MLRSNHQGGIARRKDGNSKRHTQLLCEPLEARRLLTTVVVNTIVDGSFPPGSGTVSLRDAVAFANTSSSPTTITFDPTVFSSAKSIVLNGAILELANKSQATTIKGPLAGLTIDGNKQSYVLIDSGVTAKIDGIAITQGGDGGLNNLGTLTLTNSKILNSVTDGRGGGFFNTGIATLNNVTISGNTCDTSGGGVYNSGTATLTNVTVSANASTSDHGGGILNDSGGILTLTNVTVAGNTNGGGIGNFGTVTLTNVTITGNTATDTGGGMYNDGATAASFTIRNSIVAGNFILGGIGPDAAHAFNSLGFNLIGRTDGSTGFNSADLTGTIAHPLNAKLGALANNGGPTQTVLPLAGSPAIDHGNNAYIPPGITTDQRGLTRIVNGKVDIGAVEVQPVVPPTVSIVASDATATEPATSSAIATDTGTYTVSRTGSTTSALTVQLAVSGTATNGSDYATIATTITIPAGAASATIKLTPKFDTLIEPTETAILTLNTNAAYSIDPAKKSATVNIINVSPSAAGSIAGNIFHDFNGNSVLNPGEVPLSGWTVFLDDNKNGVLDAGEKSQVTGSTGAYSFTQVPNGAHRVREVLKSGWIAVSPAAGFVDVTIAGAAVAGQNFADARPVSIAGAVFNDLNGDGFKDTNEAGLSGWKVYLDLNGNGKLDATDIITTTDAAGHYSFAGIAPGKYVIRAVAPAGWSATAPAGGTETVTLSSGRGIIGEDLGYRKPA